MSVEKPHSDAAVKKDTGRDWDEWKTLLDSWGGAGKQHPEIAKYLVDEYELDGWWAQGVTVGYERLIGRRAVGQRSDGSYDASVSKTINASADKVHAALVDDALRAEWLKDGAVMLRTASAPKSARFDDLGAGVIIAAFLTAKGDDKTSLQIQGEKFASKEDSEAWKAMWKPRLEALAKHLAE